MGDGNVPNSIKPAILFWVSSFSSSATATIKACWAPAFTSSSIRFSNCCWYWFKICWDRNIFHKKGIASSSSSKVSFNSLAIFGISEALAFRYTIVGVIVDVLVVVDDDVVVFIVFGALLLNASAKQVGLSSMQQSNTIIVRTAARTTLICCLIMHSFVVVVVEEGDNTNRMVGLLLLRWDLSLSLSLGQSSTSTRDDVLLAPQL